MTNTTEKKIEENPLKDLHLYTGSEQYHKLSAFAKFICTDGVKYVAETADAYWLVDAIASYQSKLKNTPFQHWKLTLKGAGCVLTCDNGNDSKAIITQKISYTDFPQDIEMYLTDNVLLLTGEY